MIFKSVLKKILQIIMIKWKKYKFLKNQSNTYNLGKRKVKIANKLGFTADEYVIYNLDKNLNADYITEFERQLFRDYVRDYRVILDNKIVFYNIIRNFARTNKIYAYKYDNQYVSLEDDCEYIKICDKLKELGKIIYKLNGTGGGNGVKLLEYNDEKYYINRRNCSLKEIIRLLEDDNYLLEEFCRQSYFENSLYPYSVNTLRLITLKMDDGQYKVIHAFQRMGVDKENCVDNACMGGLYSEINLKTGSLSAARSHSKDRILDKDGNVIEYETHPITNSRIKGLVIPNWQKIVSEVEQLHRKISFTGISFIAWDIALEDDGIKIIEANTSCSMDLLQTFSGVRNKEIGIWLKKMRYIK